MRRITSSESVRCLNIFVPYDHEYISLISVYESLHLSYTNKCCVYPHVVVSNNIFHSPLSKVLFVLMTKEDYFSIIKIRTSNIQINFINQLLRNIKYDPTLIGDINFSFITYPTKRIRIWMWFSLNTHVFDKCFRYQVYLETQIK
jgi:hypothetical protein